MHSQLSALRHLLHRLDPPLFAHLEKKDATNLFFAYRWVLILFKREFAFEQVLRLWDGLFARPSQHLHLFLAIAVLERQRRHILEEDLDFDGLLALCVSLKGKIDLEQVMRDAAMLREYAGEAGRDAVAGLPW
jgi:TBC1 domain family member 15